MEALRIGARGTSAATPDRGLRIRYVKDLVAGSGLFFLDRAAPVNRGDARAVVSLRRIRGELFDR